MAMFNSKLLVYQRINLTSNSGMSRQVMSEFTCQHERLLSIESARSENTAVHGDNKGNVMPSLSWLS